MKTIKQTLDEFIVVVAESYGEVIRTDIPDEIFERVVQNVQDARDTAVTDLANILREEVRQAVDRHPAIVTKKLIPSDIEAVPTAPANPVVPTPVPQPAGSPPAEIPTAPPMAAPSLTPPPREVSESEDPYMHGIPNSPPPAAMGGGGAPMADEFFDPNEGVDHAPPVMTVEEERRMEAGLPRRPYRPHIHHDGNAPREIPLNAALAAKKNPPAEEDEAPFVEEVTNV